MSTITPVLLRASLSDPVMRQYEIASARSGKPLEQVMSETLTRFADVDSAKPIILSDAERRTIEQALGRNFTTGAELARAVVRAASINVDDVEIPLSQHLLDRLKTRCIGVDFETFIKKTVKQALEEFCGLR